MENSIKQICTLFPVLLKASGYLVGQESEVVEAEFHIMSRDPAYRARVHFKVDVTQSFLQKGYKSLWSALTDLFRWENSYAGDRFWRNIRDRMKKDEEAYKKIEQLQF